MRKAAVVSVGLVLLVTACGDGAPSAGKADPETLVQQALAAMSELRSYHAAFSFPAPEGDVREELGWEVEFEAPDSYRFLLFGPEGVSEERCEGYVLPDREGEGETCREVFTEISGENVIETILVGDKAYGRQCRAVGEDCERWQETARPGVAIAGPSPSYSPGWPLVALELAEPRELVGEEEVDGTATLHVRGSVNHLRAIFENERRVLTAVGVSSFGRECTAEASAPGEPPGDEVCRDLTFEESLEQQDPDLSYYDQYPASIDIWVSPDDLLVYRIAITAPPPRDEPESGKVQLVVEYSRFNEVEIEAPQ